MKGWEESLLNSWNFIPFFLKIIELSGYTARVSEMLEIFEDVQKGHCRRQTSLEIKESERTADEAEQLSSGGLGGHGEVVDLSQMSGGEVVDTEGNIALKDVAIITPCGDVVVSSLSFEVKNEKNIGGIGLSVSCTDRCHWPLPHPDLQITVVHPCPTEICPCPTKSWLWSEMISRGNDTKENQYAVE